MSARREFDISDLPSWKYFAWGLLNGIFLGIFLKEGIDISEEGILTLIFDSFKSLMETVGLETAWISTTIFLLGVIGIVSLITEIITIYKQGWPARIIGASGFLSFLLLILGADTLGIIFFIIGVGMIFGFPDE